MSDPSPSPSAAANPAETPLDTYNDNLGNTWTLMQDKMTFTISGAFTQGPMQGMGTYDSAQAVAADRTEYDIPTPPDVQTFADGCLTAYQQLSTLSGQANDLELDLEKVNGFVNTVVTICNVIGDIPVFPFTLFKDVASVVSGVQAATTEAAQKILSVVESTTWQMAVDADALHEEALKTKVIPPDGVQKIQDASNLILNAANQIKQAASSS